VVGGPDGRGDAATAGRSPVILEVAAALAAAGQAGAIIVSPDGPTRSLTAAVARAPAGGRIVVRPGVYRESTIVLSRPVTIEGDAGAVVDPGGAAAFVVTADSVHLRGLTIRNVAVSFIEDRAAIRFDAVVGCEATGNRLEGTFFGIYLAAVRGCRVADNVVLGTTTRESHAGNAIHAWHSRGLTIEGNLVEGHRDGIYFEFVTDAHVRNNESRNNGRYGLHFMFSDSCEYVGNLFRSNGAGVAVMYSKHVAMRENRFEENWGSAAFGLLLKDIGDSRIEHNRFIGNTVGLYAESADRIMISGNQFVRNGWALKLLSNAVADTVVRNDFIGNGFDVVTNSRRNAGVFMENYWDRYRGYDLDRDGYGDVPYRPVRLFAWLVQRYQPALILMRSPFVDLLDAAERVAPVLTPEALADVRPRLEALP